MTINSWFGFCTLIAYIATIIPSNLIKVLPKTKQWKANILLLKQRRNLGLISLFLSIPHTLISISKYNLDFFSLPTYGRYFSGIIMFLVFTLLGITSNNWSIRKLKKKWKKIHNLTYLVLLLLPLHIVILMRTGWTIFTPVGITLTTFTILLYLVKIFTQLRKDSVRKSIESAI